ncbi:putative leader peptide [Actinospica robiniae]|uniref:putative leader peptide n=1 Tax=Actinospica robiniae TaxID=304901 RepID=UPI0012FB07F3|nr:putative leader peptide [Actinospica robiniae]
MSAVFHMVEGVDHQSAVMGVSDPTLWSTLAFPSGFPGHWARRGARSGPPLPTKERGSAMAARRTPTAPLGAARPVLTARRHVDLARVSSAICLG